MGCLAFLGVFRFLGEEFFGLCIRLFHGHSIEAVLSGFGLEGVGNLGVCCHQVIATIIRRASHNITGVADQFSGDR